MLRCMQVPNITAVWPIVTEKLTQMEKLKKVIELWNIGIKWPSSKPDLEFIKTNILIKMHDDHLKNVTSRVVVLEALSREFRSGVPWEDLYADNLVIITESLEECVKRLLTWKEAMEEKRLRVNAGKTKIMICGTGMNLRQARFHAPTVAMEWAATASSAMPATTGCTRNAVGSSAWQRTLITDVHSARNCMPLGWQTTERSPIRTWQAGGSSFLLLPRRYALSSQWLWTFNHNVRKPPGRGSKSCYQFSLPATSLSRQVAGCTALVCGLQCLMT